jgi:hypothetical protein
VSYEPDLPTSQRCNVYEEDTYKLRVLFGSGAITSYRSKDATISRNSAGNYTVTLPCIYEEITGFTGHFLDASGAILFFVITSSSVDTDGTVVVEARTESGTATDPTSGSYGYLSLSVSKNSLNSKFTG